MASTNQTPIDDVLRAQLAAALADPATVDAALGDPDKNLFDLGLDSLRAFGVIEELAAHGVDVDFLDFTENPTVGFLRASAEEAGRA